MAGSVKHEGMSRVPLFRPFHMLLLVKKKKKKKKKRSDFDKSFLINDDVDSII
jgi:hypothetical protein